MTNTIDKRSFGVRAARLLFVVAQIATSAAASGLALARPQVLEPVLGAARKVVANVEAGNVTGTVFRDFNANGVQDAGEPGVAGVTVTAFDGTVTNSIQTGSNGGYSLATPGPNARIEFSLPAGFQSSPVGTNSNSSVRFVPGPSSNVNFGMFKPSEFCQSNPQLASTCFIFGDNINGTFQNENAVTSHPYNATGINAGLQTVEALARQVGSVYGVAYQRSSKSIFVSAYTKRLASYGPGAGVAASDGTGTIYRISAGAPAEAVPFVDLDVLFGANTTGANPHTGFTLQAGNFDNGAFAAVGKTALGDIEIGEDDSTLWAVNLANNSLYGLPIGFAPTAPAAGQITVTAVPSPSCTNGVGRPFGVKPYNGLIYVGGVCTAEDGGTADNLLAYVYAYNPATSSWGASPVLQFPLNYPRGCSDVDGYAPTCRSGVNGSLADWRPWRDTLDTTFPGGYSEGFTTHPQPMLSDIEFLADGSMVVAFRDRFADQIGAVDPGPQNNTPGGFNLTAVPAGDILRASASGGTWTIENNAQSNPAGAFGPSAGANNQQGPGNGEFYLGDTLLNVHDETSVGGLAHVSGADNIASSAHDPLRTASSGVIQLSNSTGAQTRAYEVNEPVNFNNTDDKSFRKANGMGDIEALCDAAPIEIGNRVWLDANNNGVQDPGESPIANVQVRLTDRFGNSVIATTDANGEYRFSSAAGTNTSNAIYNLNTGAAGAVTLSAFSPFTLTVDRTQSALSAYQPSPANNDATANGDLRDSDGVAAGNNVVISLTTGAAGNNNHSHDFGFAPQQLLNLGNRVWYDTNNDGIVNGGEAGVNGVTVQLYRDVNGDGVYSAADGAAIANTTTNASGFYTFTGLQPDGYLVVIPASNFASGAVLNGYNNSTLTDGGNADVDNRDHGTVLGTQAPGLGLDGTALVASSVVTLTAGGEPPAGADTDGTNGNLTLDFGFYKLMLGNQVWNDVDNSGTLNGSEQGINGVTVRLYRDTNGDNQPDGAAIATTTTANGGFYSFNVQPGDYIVEIVPPTGYRSSTGNGSEPAADPDGNINNDDNGTETAGAGSPIRSLSITLTPGSEVPADSNSALGQTGNNSLDFGIYQPAPPTAALGNYVWIDSNGNGVQDEVGTGVNGVTVTLYNATTNQVVATTFTGNDANGQPGYYTFSNLISGTYFVVFTPPPNYAFTGQNLGGNEATDSDASPATGRSDNVVLNAGQINPDVDAGLQGVTLSLGDFVWYDTNDNGVVDSGEQPINGVVVNAYRDNGDGVFDPATDALVGTQTTGANGQYLFTNLVPGNYFVQVPQSNFVGNGALVGYQNSTGATPGDAANNRDHGTPSAGNGVVSELVTLSVGGEPDTPADGDGTNSNRTIDFGFYSLTLGDQVWNDTNNDGLKQPSEAGVPNVTVRLLDANGNPLGTTTTDANGIYTFTGLASGSYRVEIVLPPGYSSSNDAPTSANPDNNTNDDDNGVITTGNVVRSNVITLTPGSETGGDPSRGSTVNNTLDFGIVQLASLGDRVWLDTNQNGIQDAGEDGVPGVTVVLYDVTGTPVQTQTTDGNGNYLFANLSPGTYYVGVVPPPGYTVTQQNANGNNSDAADSDISPQTNRTDAIVLDAGENDLTNDAGLFVSGPQLVIAKTSVPVPSTPTQPSVVRPGDLITYTLIVTNVGNVGLSNVVISDAIPAGTSFVNGSAVPNATANNGVVSWTLLSLAVGQAQAVRFTVQVATTTTVTSIRNVASASSDQTTRRDSNEVVHVFQTQQIPANVGNYVWIDTNRNGQQDEVGTGVPGVVVRLVDINGNVVATTTTNAQGQYLFTNVAPGTYTVNFTLPPGYDFTQVGNNPSSDSDSNANPTTGSTAPFVVVAGTDNLTLDAGLVVALPVLNIVKDSTPPSSTLTQPSQVREGDTITYRIRVQNTGRVTATNVVVTDVVPVGTEYVPNSANPAAVLSGRTLRWTLTQLAPEQSATVSFNVIVRLNQNAGQNLSIRNVAYLLSGGVTTQTLVSNQVTHVISPTAVTLMSFAASGVANGTELRWRTGVELNSFGFILYRSATGNKADRVQINADVIAATGSNSDYRFVDVGVGAGAGVGEATNTGYTYWLVEVETTGNMIELASTTMNVTAPVAGNTQSNVGNVGNVGNVVVNTVPIVGIDTGIGVVAVANTHNVAAQPVVNVSATQAQAVETVQAVVAHAAHSAPEAIGAAAQADAHAAGTTGQVQSAAVVAEQAPAQPQVVEVAAPSSQAAASASVTEAKPAAKQHTVVVQAKPAAPKAVQPVAVAPQMNMLWLLIAAFGGLLVVGALGLAGLVFAAARKTHR